MSKRFGLKAEQAFTPLSWADLELAERGRLEEAATLLEQFGNQVVVHQIRQRLRQLARMGTCPQLPAGLS